MATKASYYKMYIIIKIKKSNGVDKVLLLTATFFRRKAGEQYEFQI